ncbi:MAG TPA: glycosyltransferase family 2 protein [Terriglobia bacterium]|nr:glycosyltransferase family 2 protein [Terriglobia bacterium]
MPPISATIITLNEAESIARTIRSLQSADEIVVVDSGSTDATREIAASLGARVIGHHWEGFTAQKNFAARQASHDWILSLDADEELDPKAQQSVERWKSAEPACAGYRFARRARYLGRWIRHSGWYPDAKVRLYDRRRGGFEGDYVHESVLVNGRVETLPGEILHYTCDSLEDHRRRIEFYTGLAAEQMLARGERAGWLRRKIAPAWAFVRSYFFRLGLLDGIPGFWIAWMASCYVARKYAKAAAALAVSRRH